MIVRVAYKSRLIPITVKKTGFFTRGIGLMFKSRFTSNLLFAFDKPVRLSITSFFVFFPFLALWLDRKNNVIHKEIILPWELAFKPEKPFYSLIEVPINEDNRALIAKFVEKRETFKYFRR
jgi:uncharacterized membrane protein (UPF0127 family)